ncbi:hypothetical protein EXIGLDRAFT_661129 [Exidia glandulosa HHB12029]|uniref:CBD9-like protein n=1 Tax=Exidia glandulosa HHB12029 TaxID=1314781 RepID=A0A165ARV0_EXIGL|nr:hypothetical protein EXIGLDRAFT_661129 [Exidia glandulosa HHB12029]
MRPVIHLVLWTLYASCALGRRGGRTGGDDDDDDDGRQGRDGDGDDNDDGGGGKMPELPEPASPSAVPSSPASTLSPPSSSTSAQDAVQPTPVLKGDRTCVNEIMCVGITVNGSATTFDLSPFSPDDVPGWMAIGFGEQMAGSPMIIMWANPDGSLTLSQRQAEDCVQPSVVANPPHTATVVSTASGDLMGPQPTFSFSIPTLAQDELALIWAYCDTNPGAPDTDTTITQHLDSGAFVMDVSQPLASLAAPSPSSGSSLVPGQAPMANPQARSPLDELRIYESMIKAHAVMFGIAFLVLLPSGALVARLTRTWNRFWFPAHWLIQFFLAGPLVVAAFGVAVSAVKRHRTGHFNDTHKKVGLALFILYIVQCAIGAFIHFVKSPKRTRRPPQNYGHAIVGLVIFGLALYQVHLGYTFEWPVFVATSVVPHGVSIAWTIWAVGIPLLYALGLVLLPRQWRQERRLAEEKPVALEQTQQRPDM